MLGVLATPAQTAADEHPPCILVVDADPGLAAGLTQELQFGFGGEYQFLATLNARSGLGILERLGVAGEPVALAIAGLRLPDMEGPEFLGRARKLHPLAKRVAVVGVNELVTSVALHRAMTLGQADSWLLNTWAPHDQSLRARVADLLEEWREDSGRQQLVLAHAIGEWRAPRSVELRERLERSGVPYRFTTAESAEGRELLRRAGCGTDRLPVAILADGRVLIQPTGPEVAAAHGLRLQPDPRPYDVAVVGGGLAGLSAAVCAASEGLRTVMIERETVGGQAGTTSRVRNYLGFPRGISGRRLAFCATEQALMFGVETVLNEATGLRPEGKERIVLLRDGSAAVAHAVVIATGVSYRRLGVPAAEALVGAGVFYGSALSEAPALRGEDAVVVGAGNSAGQAAVYLAGFARQVTLVARGESLEESMSAYLVKELRSLENVAARLRTQVVDAEGTGRLEQVTLEDGGSGARETVLAAALFVLIGGEPRTEWLAGLLERDEGGYLRTGADLADASPPPDGAPLSLETSVPGVFAAGDVRVGATKRMATAVGDGAIAIRQVHDYLGRR
jgi:thioredoxin reductase (NADPH)